MYRQVDGIAMGSPLGPVFANIFMAHCESLIPTEVWSDLYRRYMDDTFSLFPKEQDAVMFLARLNGVHKSLTFTMESKKDGRLPFLDVSVIRQSHGFSTTVYRKPTFTDLYLRWNSYAPKSQKIALVKSLSSRAKRLCSSQYLDDEIIQLTSILQRNGYPVALLQRLIAQVLQGSERKPVSSSHAVIRLPWLGHKSLPFKRMISQLNDKFAPTISVVCCFTTKNMFPTTNKDVLPMTDQSKIVYLRM